MIKISKLFFFMWVSLLFVMLHGPSFASTFEMVFQKGKLDITAEDVPLVTILEEIAARTGVKIMSGADLDEQVSCNFENDVAEEILKRLLKHHNSVFLFRKDKGAIVLDTVRVMGSNKLAYLDKNKKFSDNAPAESQDAEADSFQKRYSKNEFSRELTDSKKLAKQLQAEPNSDSPSQNTANESDPQNYGGIRVTQVAENSIFNKIGILENDLITDVNGTAVSSTSILIDLMRSASRMASVRIERYREDGLIDPIYIDLK